MVSRMIEAVAESEKRAAVWRGIRSRCLERRWWTHQSQSSPLHRSTTRSPADHNDSPRLDPSIPPYQRCTTRTLRTGPLRMIRPRGQSRRAWKRAWRMSRWIWWKRVSRDERGQGRPDLQKNGGSECEQDPADLVALHLAGIEANRGDARRQEEHDGGGGRRRVAE